MTIHCRFMAFRPGEVGPIIGLLGLIGLGWPTALQAQVPIGPAPSVAIRITAIEVNDAATMRVHYETNDGAPRSRDRRDHPRLPTGDAALGGSVTGISRPAG